MKNSLGNMDGVSRSKYEIQASPERTFAVRVETIGRVHDVLGSRMKVEVENLSERGPVEIPVRHIYESGCKFTFDGMDYTPAVVRCLIEYNLATKTEARWLRKFASICE